LNLFVQRKIDMIGVESKEIANSQKDENVHDGGGGNEKPVGKGPV